MTSYKIPRTRLEVLTHSIWVEQLLSIRELGRRNLPLIRNGSRMKPVTAFETEFGTNSLCDVDSLRPGVMPVC